MEKNWWGIIFQGLLESIWCIDGWQKDIDSYKSNKQESRFGQVCGKIFAPGTRSDIQTQASIFNPGKCQELKKQLIKITDIRI